MNYEREIIRVLSEAGNRGLKTEFISRYVYNACNSTFVQEDYEEVQGYVRQFLRCVSTRKSNVFIKRIERGRYRLNRRTPETRQYLLQFLDVLATRRKPKIPEVDS